MKNIIKLPLFLGAVCLIATGALATVNHFTEDRILANENAKKNENYLIVLDLSNAGDKILPEAPVAISNETLLSAGVTAFYEVKNADDSVYGIAYDAVVTGYAGEIKFQVGFVGDQYAGFRASASKESPGFGEDYIAALEDHLGVDWEVEVSTSESDLELLTMDAAQGGKSGTTKTRDPIIGALIAAANDYQDRIGG